jgi:hypothetical protein
MHFTFRDVEIDAVEGDDLAKRLADPARTNGEPLGRAVMLFSCFPQTRQFVSGLGMNAPGTLDGR